MAKDCKVELCEIYQALKDQNRLNELFLTRDILADPNNNINELYVNGELITPGIEDVIDSETYLRTNGSWTQSDIFDDSLYYKLDGTLAITADFQGGSFQIKDIADGTDDSDAVTLSQLNAKENLLGNPSADGYILSSLDDGTRSWVEMPASPLWEAGTEANSIQIINHTAKATGLNSFAVGVTRTNKAIEAHGPGAIILSSSDTKDVINNGLDSVIIGGYDHRLESTGYGNSIIGGVGCSIFNDGYNNGIFNSNESFINSRKAIIIGGEHNSIDNAPSQKFNALIACEHTQINNELSVVGIGIRGVSGTPILLTGIGVHVPEFYIHTLGTGTSVSNLGIDSNGRVITVTKGANINNYYVEFTGNLTNHPSLADLNTLIPTPIQGEIYGVKDTSGHSFLVIYDGTDFWYEKFNKAN